MKVRVFDVLAVFYYKIWLQKKIKGEGNEKVNLDLQIYIKKQYVRCLLMV